MVFRKVASITHLAALEAHADGGLCKVAAAGAGSARTASHYVTAGATLDVRALLDRVADRYAISREPEHYLFEAIRANTTNVPNENHDAFPRHELLRWDARLGTPVYLTYREKPHHVNHRTENPKTARGVIVDAHYNDDTQAAETCPNCDHKTASAEGRDPSGIHCAKCGSTVKDEFVEILVAIDANKDATFAEGVRTGQLKAGSMGCNCISTVCNVCQHVARSVPEFCEHIRAGNKGTYWTRDAGSWKRIALEKAKFEFAKRGSKFDTRDLCAMRAGDFEVRKAYEDCMGVEFDEYSRVDQPADPKALTREVLGKTASAATPTTEELRMESEQLIARATRQARRAARTAMKYYVVRVDGDPMDTYAAESPEKAMELAMLDEGSAVELAAVEAEDAGAARISVPDDAWVTYGGEAQPEAMEPEADVTVNIDESKPEDEAVSLEPDTMEDFTEDELLSPEPAPGPGDSELTPEEMGVIPPGASKEGTLVSDFADAYHDWYVDITKQGNVKVSCPAGPLMLIKPSAVLTNDTDKRAFGRELLGHLQEYGVVRTAKRYNALYHARFATTVSKSAQVVEYAEDDMADFSDKDTKDNVSGGGDNDMAATERGDYRPDVRDDNDEDMADARSPEVETVLQDHAPDHELEGGAPESAVADSESDMRDGRKPYSMADTALDDEAHDHSERLASLVGKRVISRTAKVATSWLVDAYDAASDTVKLRRGADSEANVSGGDLLTQWMQLDQADLQRHEARLKKVYAAKAAADRKAAIADFARALRVVAKRQALNQELSPLKEAMGVQLSNPKTVGYDAVTQAPLDWQPISGELAMHLIEAAWKDGGDLQVNKLIDRATELMERSAEYLVDAESELNKMAHTIPPVTAASVVDDAAKASEVLRHEANSGNMQLTSSAEQRESADQRRANLRDAVNGGIVGSRKNQYRPN